MVIHLSTRSYDAMYGEKARVNYSPFTGYLESFFTIFLVPGLITCFNRVWNYCYIYRSDLRPFKCWSSFHFFLGLLASFLHARLIFTDVWQAIVAHAIESRKNSVVSHAKGLLKCHYDENCVFSIEAVLEHKQVACTRRKMLFTLFKYLFLFQRYSSF